jgi:hypothetical protein
VRGSITKTGCFLSLDNTITKQALVLEIIFNHEYDKSRFLRGCEIDESKLAPSKQAKDVPAGEIEPLKYVNRNNPHFNLLDKFLSFDDNQNEILLLKLPQIIIGSAGSGKIALTLGKITTFEVKILYVTLLP